MMTIRFYTIIGAIIFVSFPSLALQSTPPDTIFLKNGNYYPCTITKIDDSFIYARYKEKRPNERHG